MTSGRPDHYSNVTSVIQREWKILMNSALSMTSLMIEDVEYILHFKHSSKLRVSTLVGVSCYQTCFNL